MNAAEPGRVDRPSPISLRLVAAVIDFTIVMVLVVVIVAVAEAAGAEGAGNWLAIGAAALYPIVAIGRFDRTVGKLLCSLVVRSEDGGRPGWGRSVVRFVVTAVPLVGGAYIATVLDDQRVLSDLAQVLLGAATYAPILFDDQRRGVHDRIARTRVVCTSAPVASIVEHLDRARSAAPPASRGQ